MRVVVRRMSSLAGLEVSADEALDTDRVTLGRGTDQDIQLPDMRVTLAHATLMRHPGGGYRLECLGDNPAWVNGSPMQVATLGIGDTIDLGRFRLTIHEPEAGQDLLIEVAEHLSARDEKGKRRREFQLTLDEAGLRKRRWAWVAAAVMLLALLAAPLLVRQASPSGASLDAAWDPGPPSAAHSPFEKDCAKCHQTPFARVKNEACLACHKGQPHHTDNAAMLSAEGMDGARCASCHHEHTGRDHLVARSPALCTNCHADPGEHYAAAHLPPVHRFDTDHPGFMLSLPQARGAKVERIEVAQLESATLREDSGLKFPHDVHLAARGVKGPAGLQHLACADCHAASARGFAPVRMEDHCASCHTLAFDPDAPDRHLPHGSVPQAMATIHDHYARMALAGGVKEPAAPEVVRLLRRPGEVLTRQQSQAALEWADAQSARAIEDVFTRRVCVECHEVTPSDHPAQPFDIAPVMLTSRFLTHARFDHVAHRTEACSRCHTAEASKLATDVLIPPLANCRECHSDKGGSGRVATACVDCHGFHTAQKTIFGELMQPAEAAR